MGSASRTVGVAFRSICGATVIALLYARQDKLSGIERFRV
jgi:hypothetical protein